MATAGGSGGGNASSLETPARHATLETPARGGGSGGADAGAFLADALTKAGIMDADSARAYGSLFSRYMRQQRRATLDWSKISPPSRDMLVDYAALEACPPHEPLQHELLNKIAIVKLNGGLGTSMGCRGPKSAIHVRSGHTFLDLTVRQVEWLNARHGVDVPLVLMNSFRTHESTVRLLNKYQSHAVTITCFEQSCYPRVDRDHYTPVPVAPYSRETEEGWAPPGHGDVYRALDRSGVLDALLAQGKEIAFISNIDNLGASVDLNIINYLVSTDAGFAMEVRGGGRQVCARHYRRRNGVAWLHTHASVISHHLLCRRCCAQVTDKTRSDVQGGTLIQYESKVKLLELAQVPREHQQDFKSLRTFTCFNSAWGGGCGWARSASGRRRVCARTSSQPAL